MNSKLCSQVVMATITDMSLQAMEIVNNKTGELICRQEPVFGGTGKVDLPERGIYRLVSAGASRSMPTANALRVCSEHADGERLRG